MCWSTYPRIPMPSSRHPSFGLSSIGSSTAGNGQHQSFSFPILSFCLWSMRGTSRKLIEAGSHSDDNVSMQTFLLSIVFFLARVDRIFSTRDTSPGALCRDSTLPGSHLYPL